MSGSGILPCLQANKLACYCFMDTGRRHETLGQKQRTLLQQSNQHEFLIGLGFSTTPSKSHRVKVDAIYTHRWFVWHLGNKYLGECAVFMLSGKQISLERDFILYLSFACCKGKKTVLALHASHT